MMLCSPLRGANKKKGLFGVHTYTPSAFDDELLGSSIQVGVGTTIQGSYDHLGGCHIWESDILHTSHISLFLWCGCSSQEAQNVAATRALWEILRQDQPRLHEEMPPAFTELWEVWEEALTGVSSGGGGGGGGEEVSGRVGRGAGVLATDVAERARQEQLQFVQSLLSSVMPQSLLSSAMPPSEPDHGRGAFICPQGASGGGGDDDGAVAETGQRQLGVDLGVTWEDLDKEVAMAATSCDVVSAEEDTFALSTPVIFIPAPDSHGLHWWHK